MIEISISAELVVQMLSDGEEFHGTLRVSRGLPAGVRFVEAVALPPVGQPERPPDLVLRFADGSEALTVLTPMVTREEGLASMGKLSWEQLHQSFAARLHEKEKEG